MGRATGSPALPRIAPPHRPPARSSPAPPHLTSPLAPSNHRPGGLSALSVRFCFPRKRESAEGNVVTPTLVLRSFLPPPPPLFHTHLSAALRCTPRSVVACEPPYCSLVHRRYPISVRCLLLLFSADGWTPQPIASGKARKAYRSFRRFKLSPTSSVQPSSPKCTSFQTRPTHPPTRFTPPPLAHTQQLMDDFGGYRHFPPVYGRAPRDGVSMGAAPYFGYHHGCLL